MFNLWCECFSSYHLDLPSFNAVWRSVDVLSLSLRNQRKCLWWVFRQISHEFQSINFLFRETSHRRHAKTHWKIIIAELHVRAWSFVELDTTNSFTNVSNKISKINYLIWAGLRHSVTTHLKKSNCLRSELSLILTIDNKEFDILKKKSKDCYMLIKRIIAECPENC